MRKIADVYIWGLGMVGGRYPYTALQRIVMFVVMGLPHLCLGLAIQTLVDSLYIHSALFVALGAWSAHTWYWIASRVYSQDYRFRV